MNMRSATYLTLGIMPYLEILEITSRNYPDGHGLA